MSVPNRAVQFLDSRFVPLSLMMISDSFGHVQEVRRNVRWDPSVFSHVRNYLLETLAGLYLASCFVGNEIGCF